jgi:hypothetical protein
VLQNTTPPFSLPYLDDKLLVLLVAGVAKLRVGAYGARVLAEAQALDRAGDVAGIAGAGEKMTGVRQEGRPKATEENKRLVCLTRARSCRTCH